MVIFQQLKQDMEVDIDGMLNNCHGKNIKKFIHITKILIY